MRAAADAPGEELLAALELPRPRATLVLNGGTAPLPGPLGERLAAVLAGGVARLARRERLTVVTGGTDAGIFSLYARGVTTLTAPLVGVAPAGLVQHGEAATGPARDEADSTSVVPLEPGHSHHLVVDGDRWGDETPAMLRLVAALAAYGPSAALLAGGGAGAGREATGHMRAGRPVLVLVGSGRLADDVARARGGASVHDDAAALAASPLVTVIELAVGPVGVANELLRLLGLHPVAEA